MLLPARAEPLRAFREGSAKAGGRLPGVVGAGGRRGGICGGTRWAGWSALAARLPAS